MLEDIINEVKNYKSFYFMPYKESMADSINPIYQLMLANDYNVNYRPTRYKEIDLDRNVVKECYEFSGIVEMDAETTGDVVFYHNPYDGNNRITEVERCNWSDELRKRFKYLVYVPYYGVGIVPTEIIIQKGVLNADLIIVNSEEERQWYIKVIKDYCKKDYSDRIKAYGSPKVLWEHFYKEIPAEWKNKINGKSITLLNIGIVPYMNNPRTMIEYLEMVSKKKDYPVTIWFRPHPLLKRTVEMCTPQYYGRYLEIIDRINQSNDKIYDDTDDLWRALNNADFMISTPSSLIGLFKSIGKGCFVIE